jgi:hypothetical protein
MSTTIDSSPPSSESERRTSEPVPKRLSALASDPRFWRNAAPKKIGKADNWQVWSQHLQKRGKPVSLGKLCKSDSTPLGWGLNREDLSARTNELLKLQGKLADDSRTKDAEQTLEKWLKASAELPLTLDFALECLAVAHCLPRLTSLIEEELWWELLEALWQISQSAIKWRSDAELPPEQGVSQQLLAGELTLTLAYHFPEMRPVYKLHAAASEALTEGILELLNGEGLIKGTYLAYLRPLLASWTRCSFLGASFKKKPWNRKAQEQFHQFTTHALGLSSPQGTSLLGTPHDAPWTADFLRNVLHSCNDAADISTARSYFKKKLTASLRGKQVDVVPEPAENCEWAGVAYMRTEWERTAPTVAVDYSTPDCRLEVWADAKRLIAGNWCWETTLDGKRLEPVGTWEENCWFSDFDVDYLELSIDLAGGARLERQILLAREELFLFLNDNVIDTAGGKVCHRYRLPLAKDVSFMPEKETREGMLGTHKPVARVLPLALPEWRSDPRVGKLLESSGHLQLEQGREGKNIACPLLIDLKKSRAGKPCTWRQLTVAQSLEIQSHDVAVGYRAQCGKQQWLIYRSLAEAANRTLLGQNISVECVIARFLAPSGEIDELLEIE